MENHDSGKLYYVQAGERLVEPIFQLVQNTILTVYPKFYREEIVEFFCKLHSLESIANNIRQEDVFVLGQGDVLIGTGAVSRNHIRRMYVAPPFQGMGYGRFILRRLEREIQKQYPTAQLEASLPARRIYEHCGYTTIRRDRHPVDNNLVLIYEVMEKALV